MIKSPVNNRIMDWMMQAADLLDLDVAPLSDILPAYRIGQGARSIHYFEMATQGDGFPGVALQRNKRTTVEVLARLGLPAPNTVSVSDHAEAVEAARRVGFPCVVKPVSAGQGIGVTAGIISAALLEVAIEQAARRSGFPILVENHVAGDDHRLMVVNDQLLWAYRRRAPFVVGDGIATIAELIGHENIRREQAHPAHRSYLKSITADVSTTIYLRELYAFDLASIPREGQRIKLADVANLARGGTLKDVTFHVHPDNREMAIATARTLRLKNLGIDFITPDISKSWREVSSAIIEVNATPGISGVGDACLALRTAFPHRLAGRIPTFLVTGGEVCRDEIANGLCKGLSEAGVFARRADCPAGEDRFDAVRTLLDDTQVEALVVCCAPEAVRSLVLPLRHCDVLITADDSIEDNSALSTNRKLVGKLSANELREVIAEVTASYADSDLGGALPALELLAPVDGEADYLILRIWRIRAVPSTWFWTRLSKRPSRTRPIIGPVDLLAATLRLADDYLILQQEPATALQADIRESDGAWATPFRNFRLPVEPGRAKAVEAALRRATAVINKLLAE